MLHYYFLQATNIYTLSLLLAGILMTGKGGKKMAAGKTGASAGKNNQQGILEDLVNLTYDILQLINDSDWKCGGNHSRRIRREIQAGRLSARS
jgi:hypothetical protein